MAGVTEPPWRSRFLFGEQESTEQVNCIVSSMHQAGPLYPQLLTYRCGAANRRFGPTTEIARDAQNQRHCVAPRHSVSFNQTLGALFTRIDNCRAKVFFEAATRRFF